MLARGLRGTSVPRALLPGPQVLELRNGLRLEVPELIDLLVLKEIVYDDVYGLRHLGPRPSLVVDVGAGIGDFAILAASRFPNATVIACEPNRETYTVLTRNAARNDVPNLTPLPVAVGAREAYGLRPCARAAEGAVVEPSGAGSSVGGRRLDDVLAGRKADLVKIDCEGAELDVLASLGQKWTLVERFAIEYHDHLEPDCAARVASLLRDAGFKVALAPDPYDGRIGYVYAGRGTRGIA